MAIKDYFAEFYDGGTIGSGAGMSAGYVLDIGAMTDEWGTAKSAGMWPDNLHLNVRITSSCTASGKSTAYMQLKLKHGDTSACSLVAAETPYMSFGVWSDFAAGANLWSVVVSGKRLKRYVTLVPTSSQVLTGNMDAFFTIGPPEREF